MKTEQILALRANLEKVFHEDDAKAYGRCLMILDEQSKRPFIDFIPVKEVSLLHFAALFSLMGMRSGGYQLDGKPILPDKAAIMAYEDAIAMIKEGTKYEV